MTDPRRSISEIRNSGSLFDSDRRFSGTMTSGSERRNSEKSDRVMRRLSRLDSRAGMSGMYIPSGIPVDSNAEEQEEIVRKLNSHYLMCMHLFFFFFFLIWWELYYMPLSYLYIPNPLLNLFRKCTDITYLVEIWLFKLFLFCTFSQDEDLVTDHRGLLQFFFIPRLLLKKHKGGISNVKLSYNTFSK